MFILSIIPLTKIPLPSTQVLDYFSSSSVPQGGIVEVSLHSRKLLGIVLASHPVSERKQAIKKSAFQVKSIEKVICAREIIPKAHLKLILWASQYYYAPLGLVAKTFLPRFFSRPTKKFLSDLTGFTSKESDTIIPTKIVAIPELYKIDFLRKKNLELKNVPLVTSSVSPRSEWEIWKLARTGQLRVILGTRSIFAVSPPYISRIVVYDAESFYYKSFDQQPYINAKDAALKLAEFSGAKVSMPAILPKRKICSRVELIDMREELKAGNYSIFSRTLKEQLTEVMKNNGRAILFISRKGISSGLLCRDCGFTIECLNCDVSMVYQQAKFQILSLREMSRRDTDSRFQLVCRHCGVKQQPPSLCPKCQSYRIKYIGAGTQKVEAELHKFFPDAAYARLDLDSAPKWSDQERIFDGFRSKNFPILIGTQLMLKEELLEEADLAAIITIDPLISLPDFHVGELVAKIIDTLSRSAKVLLIQTYKPDNEIFECLKKSGPEKFYRAWMRQDLENRKALSFPPFSQLIKLTYAHINPQKAESEAKVLKNKLFTQVGHWSLIIGHFDILGPAPAFIPRVKNRYIWQIMIKSKVKDLALRNKILRVIPSDWKVDVDPVEML